MKSDFFKYQAQTSSHPLAMEISHAKGSYIYDNNKKSYLDFVSGVSACRHVAGLDPEYSAHLGHGDSGAGTGR